MLFRSYAGLSHPSGKGGKVLWPEAVGAAAAAQKEKGRPSAQTGGHRPPGPPYRRPEGQNVSQEEGRLCQATGEEKIALRWTGFCRRQRPSALPSKFVSTPTIPKKRCTLSGCISFLVSLSKNYPNAPVSAIIEEDRKSTRLNSSHDRQSRMPSSA